MMNVRKAMLLIALMLSGSIILSAQSYFDDDIYYDASKDKKKTATQGVSSSKYGTENKTSYNYYDYPAADTYVFSGTSTRDVDEYNRRGTYSYADSIPLDSLIADDFAYTRRIERFYNPSVVSGSDDAQLKEYYYNTQQPSEVNIYVTTPRYWNYPYYSWNYPWYYDPWYGPSWYYDSWWGPSWYYGSYYPYYYHHHYYPHYYPYYAGPATHRPASPGAYRPARPGNGYTSGHRPSGTRYNGYRTPQRNDNGSSVATGRRPSNSSTGVSTGRRPSSSRNEGYTRPSNNDNRNDSYTRPSNSGSRGNSFSRPSSSGGRGSGASFGGGRSGGGGRGGRH